MTGLVPRCEHRRPSPSSPASAELCCCMSAGLRCPVRCSCSVALGALGALVLNARDEARSVEWALTIGSHDAGPPAGGRGLPALELAQSGRLPRTDDASLRPGIIAVAAPEESPHGRRDGRRHRTGGHHARVVAPGDRGSQLARGAAMVRGGRRDGRARRWPPDVLRRRHHAHHADLDRRAAVCRDRAGDGDRRAPPGRRRCPGTHRLGRRRVGRRDRVRLGVRGVRVGARLVRLTRSDARSSRRDRRRDRLRVPPLMVMLRGVVDQLLFGDRPDPLQAATRVVDRIGDDPVLALRAIREALVLPYACLRAEGQTLATSGTEVTHTRTLPLQLGEDAVGEIVVGLRAGELMLSAATRTCCASSLRCWRRRCGRPRWPATCRSPGALPSLPSRTSVAGSGATCTTDWGRPCPGWRSPPMPPATTSPTTSTPPTPCWPGCAMTRRRRSARSAAWSKGCARRPSTSSGSWERSGSTRQTCTPPRARPLQVTIDTPEALPDLSAAAEVAAYRIVVESLTNVARHAAATKVHVSISSHDGKLHLSVRDDGPSTQAVEAGGRAVVDAGASRAGRRQRRRLGAARRRSRRRRHPDSDAQDRAAVAVRSRRGGARAR